MKHWTRWQRPLIPALPTALRPWLTDAGSLTRLLQWHCENPFSVRLLSSQWQKPLVDEALLLQRDLHKVAMVREVLLMDGVQPQIYARTVIPAKTYHSLRRRFDGLGSQSLGEMLFTDPSLTRGPIEVACLRAGQLLFEKAASYLLQRPDNLWGRRSCFYLNGKPILVNEIFLPSAKWSDE